VLLIDYQSAARGAMERAVEQILSPHLCVLMTVHSFSTRAFNT